MSWVDAGYGVREGELFAGKYRIDRVLGAGGMGVVLLAHHVELDDRVAIKLLLPEVLRNGEAVARFLREAQAAAKITSEHVARVRDVANLANGAPYMVMEFLEGEDLGALLEKSGPFEPGFAAELLLQACEAVAEAHSLGIVHRDLKPANLFLISRHGSPFVKVVDFGLAKRVGGAGPLASITSTSATMGSPLYMSPEQMHSARDVDSRTDIWALGVILYELVTGVPPFEASSIPELVMKLLTTTPAPVASVRPELPAAVAAELEAVIGRCLEKERDKRFPTVSDFAKALARLAPSRARVSLERVAGVLPPVEGGLSEAPPSLASTSSGQTLSARRAPRTRSRARVLAVSASALALGALVFGVLARREAAEPSPAIARAASTGQLASPPPSPPPARVEPTPSPVQSASPTAPASPPVTAPARAPAAVASATKAADGAARQPSRSLSRTARVAKPARVPSPVAPAGKVDVYNDRK